MLARSLVSTEEASPLVFGDHYPDADISDVHLLEPKVSKHFALVSHLLKMHLQSCRLGQHKLPHLV